MTLYKGTGGEKRGCFINKFGEGAPSLFYKFHSAPINVTKERSDCEPLSAQEAKENKMYISPRSLNKVSSITNLGVIEPKVDDGFNHEKLTC